MVAGGGGVGPVEHEIDLFAMKRDRICWRLPPSLLFSQLQLPARPAATASPRTFFPPDSLKECQAVRDERRQSGRRQPADVPIPGCVFGPDELWHH